MSSAARALVLCAVAAAGLGLPAHLAARSEVHVAAHTAVQGLAQLKGLDRSAHTPPPAKVPADVAAPPEAPSPAPAAAAAPAQEEAAPEPSCPAGMVLAQGNHCYYWEQPCVRWDDPEGQPAKRVCGEFQKPSVCKTGTHPMRYCIDRDEYVAPGEALPATAVSWSQADMVCTSMGKRLCTNQEWEFACEGEEGFPYPYGYERAPALCNQDRLLRDGKNRASADLREPAHGTCVSPFGVRDMVGNVDEWVRQPWAKAPRRSELRGGWWMTGRNRCRANTAHHDEKYAGPQTGFRCCKDALPPEVRASGRPPRGGAERDRQRTALAGPSERR